MVVGLLSVLVAIGLYQGVERKRRLGPLVPSPLDPLLPSPPVFRSVEGMVQRLALLADLPAPALRVSSAAAPVSWTVRVPGRSAEIWLTTGLLARVSNTELEAVLGHELSHIANGDAALMGVIAGPPAALLRGLIVVWDTPVPLRFQFALAAVGVCAAPLALIAAFLGRVVSRHREFAADRGAAMITGSPAALASALMRLSGELAQIPAIDLRTVAPRDPFHLLPVKARRGGVFGSSWARILRSRAGSNSSHGWSVRCTIRASD